jgi:ubiquinol-cytochrome c reductase subunit 8
MSRNARGTYLRHGRNDQDQNRRKDAQRHRKTKQFDPIANIALAGCPTPQRIATYSLSPNRQRPFAGAANAAIFNTFRRFRHQVLYVVPPFIVAYAAMEWAIER